AYGFERREHVLDGGVAALFTIGDGEGRADLGLRDFLETLEVLARLGHSARTLQCACQAELSRSMQRIELQGRLKFLDGVVVLLEIEIDRAEVIVAIGIVRINLDGAVEVFDGLRWVVPGEMREAEAVPDVHIIWIDSSGLIESFFGFGQL